MSFMMAMMKFFNLYFKKIELSPLIESSYNIWKRTRILFTYCKCIAGILRINLRLLAFLNEYETRG